MAQLSISKVGLGGYEFEDDPDWAGAREVLTTAIDAGIDWLDTAESYFDGMNELTIGRALRDIGAEMTISTKVAPAPDGTGFGDAQIRTACETSLERLGVERVDMYLLHWPDPSGIPLEETWASMRRLVDDDLVAHVGLSNFDRADVERCLRIGPVDLLQEGLSPIDHLETRDLARWCAERGIAVVTYEPLANGMLAGAIRTPEDVARVVGEDYADWPFWQRLFSPGRFERSQAVAEGIRAVAERIGRSPAQVAIAWGFHQPGVTATLVGSRSPEHVRDDAEAASIALSESDLAELDALIPLGPAFAEEA